MPDTEICGYCEHYKPSKEKPRKWRCERFKQPVEWDDYCGDFIRAENPV